MVQDGARTHPNVAYLSLALCEWDVRRILQENSSGWESVRRDGAGSRVDGVPFSSVHAYTIIDVPHADCLPMISQCGRQRQRSWSTGFDAGPRFHAAPNGQCSTRCSSRSAYAGCVARKIWTVELPSRIVCGRRRRPRNNCPLINRKTTPAKADGLAELSLVLP